MTHARQAGTINNGHFPDYAHEQRCGARADFSIEVAKTAFTTTLMGTDFML
jgi:hypothetical protein